MLMWVYSVSHPVMIQLSASWHQISIFLVKLEAVWSREQYQVILNGGQWGMLTGELVTLALKLNGIDARWDQNAGNKFIFHTFYAGFFYLLVAWMPWSVKAACHVSQNRCVVMLFGWCYVLAGVSLFSPLSASSCTSPVLLRTKQKRRQRRESDN